MRNHLLPMHLDPLEEGLIPLPPLPGGAAHFPADHAEYVAQVDADLAGRRRRRLPTSVDPTAMCHEPMEKELIALPPHPDGEHPCFPPDHAEFTEQVFRNLAAMERRRRSSDPTTGA